MNIVAFKTCIKLFGYEKGSHETFEQFFSVPDKINMGGYISKAIEYDSDNKILTIPRGVNIRTIESEFDTPVQYSENVDPYDTGLEFMLSYRPRNHTQEEAVMFLLGKGKYEDNKKSSQLGLNLNTGVGKTYVTICCSAMMGVRSIMITSSIGWINQWKDRILEYTDTAPTEIYCIVGVGSIAMILNNMVSIKHVKYFLASHQTIHSYGNKYGWDKVGELFEKIKVGVKIYDEAHLDFDNIWRIDFYTNTNKTFYLTATPYRSDKEEDRIYQESFYTVPKIDLFNADTDPHTAYVSLLYNSYPTTGQIYWANNRFGFDRNRYCSYIVKNEMFYKILVILMDMIQNVGKTLVYIGTNKSIKIVYNWIVTNYPWLKDDVGIYTSVINNKLLKEEQLQKNIILSTTKSCGAAIDIKGLRMTIVLAEPFKSKVIARQSLGRTRDKDTYYVEVVDCGFDAISGCYRSKKEVFDKYATTVSEVSLSKSKYDYTNKEWDKNDAQLNEEYDRALSIKSSKEEEYSKATNTKFITSNPPYVPIIKGAKHNVEKQKVI